VRLYISMSRPLERSPTAHWAKRAYTHRPQQVKTDAVDENTSRTAERAPTAQVGQTGILSTSYLAPTHATPHEKIPCRIAVCIKPPAAYNCTTVPNVSRGWCCWHWQCTNCVPRVVLLALAVLQMCHVVVLLALAVLQTWHADGVATRKRARLSPAPPLLLPRQSDHSQPFNGNIPHRLTNQSPSTGIFRIVLLHFESGSRCFVRS
jgi:hypothetical protein